MNLKESSKETRKKGIKKNYIKTMKFGLQKRKKKLLSGIKPRKRASK
jgi:hypothetical protein